MAANLVDFHCHLDLYPDHAAAISASESAKVHTLTVTTTPKAWPRNRELTAQTKYVRVALGLHPQLVAERAHELPVWESYLHEARYVGEVGLDAGPQFLRSLVEQKEVFRRVLQCCSEAGGKILTVHSLRAASMVLDLIEAHLPPDRGSVVLHWFTGNRSEALRAVELGCLFSINMAMLRNERHRKLLAQLPLESFLTETDGPFTRTGPRVAQSVDVALVVDELARLRGLDPQIVKKRIAETFRVLVTPK